MRNKQKQTLIFMSKTIYLNRLKQTDAMMKAQACDICDIQKAWPAHSPADWRKKKHLLTFCPWIDAKMLRACSIFYEASFKFSAALFLHLPVWQGPPEPIYSHHKFN